MDKEKTVFVICSDGSVDLDKFTGLNVVKLSFSAVGDLFLLAKTNAIIGSDSTFGAFASYYGNIPFIVFKKGNIDWEYYKGKNVFFENKYNLMTRY